MSSKRAMKQAQKQAYAKHRSNITNNRFGKMAKDAMKQTRLLVNNPREVTEKDALNIYESAW